MGERLERIGRIWETAGEVFSIGAQALWENMTPWWGEYREAQRRHREEMKLLRELGVSNFLAEWKVIMLPEYPDVRVDERGLWGVLDPQVELRWDFKGKSFFRVGVFVNLGTEEIKVFGQTITKFSLDKVRKNREPLLGAIKEAILNPDLFTKPAYGGT